MEKRSLEERLTLCKKGQIPSMLSVAMSIGSWPDIAVLVPMCGFYKCILHGDDGRKAPTKREDEEASAFATKIHGTGHWHKSQPTTECRLTVLNTAMTDAMCDRRKWNVHMYVCASTEREARSRCSGAMNKM